MSYVPIDKQIMCNHCGQHFSTKGLARDIRPIARTDGWTINVCASLSGKPLYPPRMAKARLDFCPACMKTKVHAALELLEARRLKQQTTPTRYVN